MGVLKKVIKLVFLERERERLMQKYRSMSIFLPGSSRHRKAGLDEKHALVLAWERKRREEREE